MRRLAPTSPAHVDETGKDRHENDEGDDWYRNEKRADDGEQHHRGEDADDQHEQDASKWSDPCDVDAMRLSGIRGRRRAPSRSAAIPVRWNDFRFGAGSFRRGAIFGHEVKAPSRGNLPK